MKRKGMGKGLGRGYKNIVPKDPFIHGLSARGIKTLEKLEYRFIKEDKAEPFSDREYVAETKRVFKLLREGGLKDPKNRAVYDIAQDLIREGKLDAKGKADYVPKKTPKYEYVWGGDVFDDDNEGLLYGVEDVSDFPAYVEWFSSWEEREKNSKAGKMNIVNREQHYDYLKRKKILDAKGKLNKKTKERYLASLSYQYGNRARKLSIKLFNKPMHELNTEQEFDLLFDKLRKTGVL